MKDRFLPRNVYAGLRQMADELGGIGYGVQYANDAPPFVHINRDLRGDAVEPLAMAIDLLGDRLTAVRLFQAAGLFDWEVQSTIPQALLKEHNIGWPRHGWPRIPFDVWAAAVNLKPE